MKGHHVNAIEQAKHGYGPAQHHIRTPRTIEVQLFTEITSRLNKPNQSFPELVAAVHENRRAWRMLAVDVADDANALPQKLRAQIFYLAEFTNHHSSKVLKREATVEPLVDINMAIIRGLNGGQVTQ